MLEHSKLWIEFLAIGVEVAAALVIGLASIEAIVRALPLFARRDVSQEAKVDIRLGLGRWLYKRRRLGQLLLRARDALEQCLEVRRVQGLFLN